MIVLWILVIDCSVGTGDYSVDAYDCSVDTGD